MGQWQNDYIHGHGTLTAPSGNECQGEIGAIKDDRGVLRSPDGTVYEGIQKSRNQWLRCFYIALMVKDMKDSGRTTGGMVWSL